MRNLPTIISAAALCAAMTGCGAADIASEAFATRINTTLVVLDESGSMAPDDRELYAASMRALVADLDAGDRVMIAKAGDRGRSAFRAEFDFTVENSEVRLRREAAVAEARKQLSDAIPTILSSGRPGGAGSTRLLATIAAGAQLFGSEPRKGGRLVVLSDGVEESDVADLSKQAGNDADITRTLERAKLAGLLPDLTGVELSMIGVGGGTRYQGVERFWRAYAKATSATLIAYGRLPLRVKAEA